MPKGAVRTSCSEFCNCRRALNSCPYFGGFLSSGLEVGVHGLTKDKRPQAPLLKIHACDVTCTRNDISLSSDLGGL